MTNSDTEFDETPQETLNKLIIKRGAQRAWVTKKTKEVATLLNQTSLPTETIEKLEVIRLFHAKTYHT